MKTKKQKLKQNKNKKTKIKKPKTKLKVAIITITILAIIIVTILNTNQTKYFEIEPGLQGRVMKNLYDLNDLIHEMKNKEFVLLGESTHGTKEYYQIRAHISKQLIKKHDFNFIAVEGDWATIYELNKYVKNLDGSKNTARDAMMSLTRWPEWMWSNEEILDLVEWLREHNENLQEHERVGIYGIDVYSTEETHTLLINILNEKEITRNELNELNNCLNEFGADFSNYPMFVYQTGNTCQEEIQQLKRTINDLGLNNKEQFIITQKINVLENAEKHYRKMIHQNYDSWNARANHFAQTTKHIANYYGENSKGIVWAHNTHVGDSTHIQGAQNMQNIGQILRPNHDVLILGFVKNKGRVSAGREWGAPKQIMTLPEAKPNSYGELIAQTGHKKALFIFKENKDEARIRGHRAIGVTYNPQNEQGNYVPTKITKRYDAIIYLDETTELRTLN